MSLRPVASFSLNNVMIGLLRTKNKNKARVFLRTSNLTICADVFPDSVLILSDTTPQFFQIFAKNQVTTL